MNKITKSFPLRDLVFAALAITIYSTCLPMEPCGLYHISLAVLTLHLFLMLMGLVVIASLAGSPELESIVSDIPRARIYYAFFYGVLIALSIAFGGFWLVGAMYLVCTLLTNTLTLVTKDECDRLDRAFGKRDAK